MSLFDGKFCEQDDDNEQSGTIMSIEQLAIEHGMHKNYKGELHRYSSDVFVGGKQELEAFAKAYLASVSEQEHVAEYLEVRRVETTQHGHPMSCVDTFFQFNNKYEPQVGDKLFTHPPATVPEGYALVPIEPTKEMLVDMFRAWNACDIPKGSDSFTDWRDAYKAMLSTSPNKGTDK